MASSSSSRSESLSEAGGVAAMFEGDRIEFDLATQLTYMSGISTAGVTRDRLFELAAGLPYTTSKYFRSVRLMATKLGYNYPRACEVVAGRTRYESVRGLLLRFASSMGSGESETDFLARESEVQFETHSNRYERDLEGLRKWTDAFIALEVSVALVVIIAVVSLMIFPLGPVFVLGLSAVGIAIAVLGGYVIYRSAPSELITHDKPIRSALQARTMRKARYLVPIAILLGAGLYVATGLPGLSLLVMGVFLFPVGHGAAGYHGQIAARDRDAPAFLRALGGITAAVGTTVTEAMGRVDLRAMGALEPDVRRLHHRLKGGIRADLCWDRFVAESGSELIRRSVSVFWDGIRAGGEPARIGYFSSLFAMHVSMLRQKRALVSNTFGWLMVPMHATLVGLIVFITQIVVVFSMEMDKAQASSVLERPTEADLLPAQDALVFGDVDVMLVNSLMFVLVLALTIINGWVPNAAAGGDKYRFCHPLSIMLVVSGLGLLVVPVVVEALFSGLMVDAAV